MDFVFYIDTTSKLPVYRQVKNELKRYIEELEFCDGDQLPSVSALAAAAGCSIRTMDIALQELVKEGICYRRPKKGTFVGKSHQNSVVKKKIVLLYIPFAGMNDFKEGQCERLLYNGMRSEALKLDVKIIIVWENLESYLVRYGNAVAGVLMFKNVTMDEIAPLAERYPYKRFVYVNYFMPGFVGTAENIYGVFNDDFGGGFEIANHFFRSGSCNPRFIYFNVSDLNYEQRLQGYMLSAKLNNIKLREESACIDKATSWNDMLNKVFSCVDDMLNRDPSIDLFLTTCDLLGYSIWNYFLKKNIKNIRIGGYDGFRMYGTLPPFPTMQINFPAVGAQALHVATSMKSFPPQIKIFPKFITTEVQKREIYEEY